jgi:hypothetical protein
VTSTDPVRISPPQREETRSNPRPPVAPAAKPAHPPKPVPAPAPVSEKDNK